MSRKGNYIWLLFILMCSSCGVYKKMPEDIVLYSGADVQFAENKLEKKELNRLKERINAAVRPTPNSFLFGYPYKVGFYYLFSKQKKEDGFKAKMQKRLGEKPVTFSANGLEKNKNNLLNFLNTEGYFRSDIVAEIAEKDRKSEAKYVIKLAPRYAIAKVEFNNDSLESTLAPSLLHDFEATQKGSIITAGKAYRFDDLAEERRNVSLKMREKGYYFFSPNYINIEADSTVGQHKVDLFFNPVPVLPSESKKQYLINDIFIYTAKDSKNFKADSMQEDSDFFRGIILNDPSNAYKERLFEDVVGFRPGNYYSVGQDQVSSKRLIGLNNFQSVDSRFEVVNRVDSSFMNVHYYLVPKKRMSLRSEINGLTRSSGFAGAQFSLIWRNNNLFKGAEILDISANFGTEFQVGGKKDGNEYNNNYRIALDGTLTFPRFVSPVFKIDPEISRILPKTTINVGFNSIIKTGLYTLNSTYFSLGYLWRKGSTQEHAISPISVSLVKAKNISEAFVTEIFFDPRLVYILENQLITGGSYKFLYTPPSKGTNTIRFEGNLELVGNMAGLVDKLRNNEEKSGTIFNEVYKQYSRIDGDFRWYKQVTPKTQWANRMFLGLGIPYGNSNSLPYTRQYYSGGNSSIRAFRARGIGPGSYERTGLVSEQFLGQFTGDIKIELNTEWRYKLNSFLGTALFIDAGNVWMYKDDLIYDETAVFSKNFYKELAVGAGVGFRFDFSYFILRLDLAFPVRRPDRPLGERWVLDEISWKNKESRILNIAIGMPF